MTFPEEYKKTCIISNYLIICFFPLLLVNMQYAYLCQGVFFVVLLSMNIMYIPW